MEQTKTAVQEAKKRIRKVKVKSQSTISVSDRLNIIIDAIDDKKGKNIVSIDLTGINQSIFDYFVICHGDSTTQTDAIAHHVELKMKEKTGETPFHSEGFENSQWILIDYADIIVHVFLEPYRQLYRLEDLWADGILKTYSFD